MSKIPSYTLYGEAPQPIWHESLHVETISNRSGAHDWSIEPHRHDSLLQILYLQQGSGQVLCDSVRLAAQAPCIIHIPAQSVHGFDWQGPVEGKVITALQQPLESVAEVLSPGLLPLLRSRQVIELPRWRAAEDPLQPLFAALEEEYLARGREHPACSTALLLALIVNIFRLGESAEASPGQTHGRRSQQVRQFREQVEIHFRSHRPVSDYADLLGMTLATLGRLCQEQLGMTPLTVINARLLLEAKRELAYSGRSIKEIAHELGFSDEGYFSRFFRRHTRLTPSEFRSQARREH
ncbi:helix-turn-helix domain-containing protein [Azotobacter beijerinckii]|uniref:helix-turn-helix domain-containing protein n=1 Tax=Azotobacter beijerinckii TaxID=170623 RepID=UPI0029548EFF|nr:helix-turn-helix domain-containing protein [Azotobacter beijerinckii]MDV7209980.1 helix-turn-helix domain-containing protein [Azotobacter beijerinckii]